ncbi:hypothetical protein E8E14_001571 [Neopestalotiopsis sp. 37M]|nr:hypothetical protein E8E14_001571 [Neopestalotiopsis sp. 37M]
MPGDEQIAPISASVSSCLIAFDICLSKASQADLSVRQYSDIEDQMARFSIWTSNIAVFDAGRSCLDNRLREAKDVQRLVLGMLEVLRGQITECTSISSLVFALRLEDSEKITKDKQAKWLFVAFPRREKRTHKLQWSR